MFALFSQEKAEGLVHEKVSVGIGSTTRREDLLKEAGNLYLQVGAVEKYCELCIQSGDWLKAIAFAPGVSLTYWKALMSRYTESLAAKGDPEAVLFISLSRYHVFFIVPCALASQDALI